MKKYSTFIICIIFCLFYIACNVQTDVNETENTATEKLSINANKVVEDEIENTPLENYIIHLRKKWKDVRDPLIVTYEGAELNDYFHFSFKDAKGNVYDFADGDNNLGEYIFYDEDFNANKKYIGKEFEIQWAWKLSEFPCCDGAMNMIKTDVPSIHSIRLKE